MSDSQVQPRRFILLTKGRTASNLVMRMLNLDEQPSVVPNEPRDYVFWELLLMWQRLGPMESWSEEDSASRRQLCQTCADALHGIVERAAAADKSVYLKEHLMMLQRPNVEPLTPEMRDWLTVSVPGITDRTNTNITIFPDAYLRTWSPTFLIRHPALMYPSMCRAMVDMSMMDEKVFDYDMTMAPTRSLYEWFVAQQKHSGSDDGEATPFPVILDADDVVRGPDVMRAYSQALGFDADKLKFSWEAGTIRHDHLQQNGDDGAANTEHNPMVARMLSTLTASTGVMKSKVAGNIDLDAEAIKWREEFGEKHGKKLEELVRSSMPDYEFLRERRFTGL